MALTVIREALGGRRRAGLDLHDLTRHRVTQETERQRESMLDVMDAVQMIVNAFTDPRDGARFVASFGAKGSLDTATSLDARRVQITPEPLFDASLKLAEAAEVLTGLTCHEIGHMLLTTATDKVLKALWPGDRVMHVLANVGDDARLEAWMKREYPGVGGAFRPMLEWLARRAGTNDRVYYWADDLPMGRRLGFMTVATRYAFAARWRKDVATRTERAWWLDWATRYANEAWDDASMIRLLTEAKLRITARSQPEPEDEPEPEPGPEPGKGGEGKGQPGKGQPGKGEGKPEPKPGSDDDEEIDEPEESELGSGDEDDDDLDDDADDDDGGWGDDDDDLDDEDGDDADDPTTGEGNGDGEGNGGDEDDEDGEGDPLDSGDRPGRDPYDTPERTKDVDESQHGDGAGGSGVNPVRAENGIDEDFDNSELPQGVDDLQPSRWGDQLDEIVKQERQIEKIVDRDGFGTMKVRVVD